MKIYKFKKSFQRVKQRQLEIQAHDKGLTEKCVKLYIELQEKY